MGPILVCSNSGPRIQTGFFPGVPSFETIEIHGKILKNLPLQNHLTQVPEIWCPLCIGGYIG